MRNVIRFCSILCVLGFITPTATASLINPDISVEGNVTFDINPISGSLPATGNASQSADISKIIGSTATISTVNNVTPSGANPFGGGFTDYGDGLGIDASALSTLGIGNVRDFIFDFDFSLSNNSATDFYKIYFELVFSNSVNANGADAFVDSEINLFDSASNEIFFSDLTSDTANGDEKNGAFLASAGASLTDSGTFLFDFTLAAGATNSFSALLKMDGGGFTSDALFSASSSAFIRVVGADNLTNSPTPTPVPEPSTLILFAAVIGLLKIKRKVIN
ncbi:PEP-CTERM sorting domain-containing protein [Cognaticolwellia mytili]|uniref:PEP-CTERM sorting domain-containing protein n=1 Tax=Cognaticolwellia mytili TaxID=1888913 RepID=UPI000A177C01|nr:PEP-CTERM sorting domain-containing protein [Cognaticolwellia mytili]